MKRSIPIRNPKSLESGDVMDGKVARKLNVIFPFMAVTRNPHLITHSRFGNKIELEGHQDNHVIANRVLGWQEASL